MGGQVRQPGAIAARPTPSSGRGPRRPLVPAVANGMVYVGSEDGRLYAFGLPQ